ncbi:Bcr/CflA family efflux MFS transporter [Leucothrix sargassi]|nr:Bcr/CflA family efflux MFS transporter [Leucothrix sargassi]
MSQLPKSQFLNNQTPPKVGTMVALVAITSIPLNIFLPSLPMMAKFFETPYSVMQFAVTGFLLLTGLCQLFIGPLSDRFGRRPVLLTALAIFIFASEGASSAESFDEFMCYRLLQAVVVAGTALSRASVRDMVGRDKAASLIGYITMGMALAPMLTPLLGGYLGAHFGWQANFHVLSAAGLFVFVLAFFDYGETNLSRSDNFTQQFKAYPALLTSRRFWGYASTMAFSASCFFAYLGGAPFVGSVVYHLPPDKIGWFLMFTPMGYILGNFISGRFSNVLGIEKMLLVGTLITLLSMTTCLIVILSGASSPLGFYVFTMGIGFGNGMVLPNATAGLLDVNPALAGSASGLSGAIMTLGGALLSGLAGFLLTETSGPLPLVICIVLSSLCALTMATITAKLERRVNAVLV